MALSSEDGSDIFTRAALERIVRKAKGNPRAINVLCDNALITGYGSGETKVSFARPGRSSGTWKGGPTLEFPDGPSRRSDYSFSWPSDTGCIRRMYPASGRFPTTPSSSGSTPKPVPPGNRRFGRIARGPMGKIFEALEKAQREREGKGGKEPPLFVVSPGERPSSSFEVDAENEMVALSRNIDALLEASPRKVIQFIGPQGGKAPPPSSGTSPWSPRPGFGKSVLLLDADPQCPSQHLFFHLQPEFGWGEILRNRRTFRKAIRRIGKTGLYVYPTLPGSASLPEALFSPGVKEFWDAAKEKFDLVLIDSAPASASPDGISLSRYVDGVVLVLEADKTRKPVAENLKTRFSRTAEISSGWCSTTAGTTFQSPSTRDCKSDPPIPGQVRRPEVNGRGKTPADGTRRDGVNPFRSVKRICIPAWR